MFSCISDYLHAASPGHFVAASHPNRLPECTGSLALFSTKSSCTLHLTPLDDQPQPCTRLTLERKRLRAEPKGTEPPEPRGTAHPHAPDLPRFAGAGKTLDTRAQTDGPLRTSGPAHPATASHQTAQPPSTEQSAASSVPTPVLLTTERQTKPVC